MKQYFLKFMAADAADNTGGDTDKPVVDNKPAANPAAEPETQAKQAIQAPIVADPNIPLILQRLSSMPNKNGSYAYAIISGLPKGVDGVYETSNGTIMYSPARIGDLRKNAKVPYRIVAKNGNNYVNLINDANEQYGVLAEVLKAGKQLGLTGNSALDQMGATMLFQLSGLTLPAQAAAAPQDK